ncbi:MAG TPA: hypothetical protein VF753_00700 [Terriglobales bacterium]
MRKGFIAVVFALLVALTACTSRDFLTRHLASDLITNSDTFKAVEKFWLRTGSTSNEDYASPEYMVLQRRGWITAASVPCAPDAKVSACWDVALTPLGVGVFRDLIPAGAEQSQYFSVPVAHRELVRVTGIAKNAGSAEVEFFWKWVPLNEVGQALYAEGLQYKSIVTFRLYDDGWRVIEGDLPVSQGMDEALKNSKPIAKD